ncbi:MAG: hypothetical protein MJZ61_03945, partial [Bacteroidales bacterium]|nr:hypothetical protein [Bacteroidales bacterium]
LQSVVVEFGGKKDNITSNVVENAVVIDMAKYKSDIKITATYTDIVNPEYAIISADGFATPSVTSSVATEKITVTFANRTADGYKFVSATANGKAITLNSETNKYEFIMPAENVTIVTKYEAIKYAVTSSDVAKADREEATVNDIIKVALDIPDGQVIETIEVHYGDKTDDVTSQFIDGSGLVYMQHYKSDISFKVIFTDKMYNITCDANSYSIGSAKPGENVEVSFNEPAVGYQLISAKWNNNSFDLETKPYSFTMPAEDVRISATYQAIDYLVTISSSCKDNVSANRNTATIDDVVKIIVDEPEGKVLKSAFVTGNNINDDITDIFVHNRGVIYMSDYKSDIEIAVNFVDRPVYSIASADKYSNPSVESSISGEIIDVEFTNRVEQGYDLSFAYYNGRPMVIENFASQFVMPEADVLIVANYVARQFAVATDDFVVADRNAATVNDIVSFSVNNRASEGYVLSKVLVNGKEIPVNGYYGNFRMSDYISDVRIEAVYEAIKVDLAVRNISVNAGGYCQGQDVVISFSSTTSAVEYEILFDPEAYAAGFQDLGFQTILDNRDQRVTFGVPESVTNGSFVGYIVVRDNYGNMSEKKAFNFDVNYSSDVIKTKFSDMICVDNHEHKYTGYQWIKDGVEIVGANKQYFIDAPALKGSYGLILTMADGSKRRVCDVEINKQLISKAAARSVNVYPNPARSYEDVTISLADFGDDDLQDATIMIYSQIGSLAAKITDVREQNIVNLPAGAYSGMVIFNNSKLSFKFIVTE